MEKLRKYRVFIIIACMIAFVAAIWGLSRLIVSKSYSSEQYVVDKENERIASQKMVEVESETEELATEDIERNLENISDSLDLYNSAGYSGTLGSVDYSNRKIECETVENDYIKGRIQQMKDNDFDYTDNYVLLKSYYLGDYEKDYKSDLNTYLADYPEVRSMLNSLTDLDKYSALIDEACPDDKSESIKHYTIDDLNLGTEGKHSFESVLLVGVIDDRYYVYTGIGMDLNECNKYIIVDASTRLAFNEGNLGSLLKGLGCMDSLVVYANRVVRIPYEGKEIILTRGY